MNLKERIEIIDKLKSDSLASEIEIKRDFEAIDIFVKNATVEQIIKNSINKEKNIILLCPSYLDKTLASNYIRSFFDDNISVEVLRNISDNLPFVSAEKVIVPEPSVSEIIKIFELILCDFKTFVFAMNLKTFENVLESLRTLISLNCPNLSANNVEHLIGVSSALLVYIDRTEDGLFSVTNIGKIIYRNNTAFLDVLYSSVKDSTETSLTVLENNLNSVVEETSCVEEQTVSDNSDKDEEQNTLANDVEDDFADVNSLEEKLVEEEFIEEKQNDVENTDITDDESSLTAETVEDIEPQKVNKYKLLKEKIKSKKA